MDGQLPSRASFELGAKLVAYIGSHREVAAAASDAVTIMETMASIPCYKALVLMCHEALHHNPDLRDDCHLLQHALASIMSQMFACGYAAGRQEIIDAELQKMAAAS
jgi:hypothetical protein